ncbi:MAG: response regulator transcription factor, partial [Anaerolineae bacterium]
LPETRIVMLTMSESEDDLFEAIKSGASGYLLKSLDANEFINLLVGVMRGEAPLPPALVTRLMTELASGSSPLKRDEQEDATWRDEDISAELTPRQWEILKLVAGGLTYKEVAATLHLTEHGVKYHMGQILDRLHLANREQAIAYARRRVTR